MFSRPATTSPTQRRYSALGSHQHVDVQRPNPTLPVGRYRLTLDAAGGLTDEAGNALNGGSDQVFALTVGTRSEVATEPFITEENYGGPGHRRTPRRHDGHRPYREPVWPIV